MAPPNIIVHHLEASRSIRVLWLLQYLNLPYEVVTYKRDPVTKLAPESLERIHPLGRSPVLTEKLEDGSEVTVVETGAIFEHLLERHAPPGVVPQKGTQEYADFMFWIHFAEGSGMLHMVPFSYLFRGGACSDDGKAKQEELIARGVKKDFDFVEQTLRRNGGSSLMGGADLGPADMINIFAFALAKPMFASRPQEWTSNLGLSIGEFTNNWLERVYDDPHFKEAAKKEGATGADFVNALLKK